MGYLPALAAASEVALPATVAAFAVESTAAAETVPKPLGPASADEVVVEVVALFIERRNSFRLRMRLHGGKGNFVYRCVTLWSAPHDFCKSYKNVGRTLQEKDGEKVYNVTVLNSPTLRNNQLKQSPATLVPSVAGSQNVFAQKIEPYAPHLVSLIQLFFVRIQHHQVI